MLYNGGSQNARDKLLTPNNANHGPHLHAPRGLSPISYGKALKAGLIILWNGTCRRITLRNGSLRIIGRKLREILEIFAENGLIISICHRLYKSFRTSISPLDLSDVLNNSPKDKMSTFPPCKPKAEEIVLYTSSNSIEKGL